MLEAFRKADNGGSQCPLLELARELPEEEEYAKVRRYLDRLEGDDGRESYIYGTRHRVTCAVDKGIHFSVAFAPKLNSMRDLGDSELPVFEGPID